MAASLRRFRRVDTDAVVELSRHALARPEEQVGNPVWTRRDELEGEIANWEPRAEETLVVAEEEDEVVAFGGIERPRGFEHAELFGPLVAPGFRGHKLGARLLEASIDLAREHRASSLLAGVGTRNTAATTLVERAGFRARGAPQATFRLAPIEHRPTADRPDGVAVRRATEDDLDDALAVYRECFPEGRFPPAVWRENLEEGTVYAAEERGRIVGVLNIDPGDRWIYHLGVTPGERGRGVASYLLSSALTDYWERHPGETLGLDVAADNVPAIRLYRRQGFAPWLVLQTYELPL